MHPRTDKAWLSSRCAKITSFSELALQARLELDHFGNEVEIVCGPITTGGRGSLEKNIEVFNAAIKRLLRKERPLFNQMPYEDALFRLKKEYDTTAHERRTRSNPVLEEFYRPLFHTRRFTRAWFIPGWKSSQGADWERGQLEYLGVNVVDLTQGWINDALKGAA